MNFDIPQDLQDYLDELDQFIETRSSRWSVKTTTSAFSTIDAKTLVRIGSAVACLTKNGRRFWQRPSV